MVQGHHVQRKLALELGVSERTFIRYLNGETMPEPSNVVLLSRILKQPVKNIYPEYAINFMISNKRRRGEWWNELYIQLIQKGWKIEHLMAKCKISYSMAQYVLSWRYAPRERILQRLEKGLKQNRHIFWPDWQKQQQQFYKRKKWRYS